MLTLVKTLVVGVGTPLWDMEHQVGPQMVSINLNSNKLIMDYFHHDYCKKKYKNKQIKLSS